MLYVHLHARCFFLCLYSSFAVRFTICALRCFIFAIDNLWLIKLFHSCYSVFASCCLVLLSCCSTVATQDDSSIIIACCWLFPAQRSLDSRALLADCSLRLAAFYPFLLFACPNSSSLSFTLVCSSSFLHHVPLDVYSSQMDPYTLFRAAHSSLLDGYSPLITDHFSLLCSCCSLFSNCCPVLVPCILRDNRSLLSFATIYLMLAVVSC